MSSPRVQRPRRYKLEAAPHNQLKRSKMMISTIWRKTNKKIMIIIIWQCSSRTWHSRNTKSLLDQGVLLSLYQVAVVKISKIFPHLDIDDRIIPPKASKSHQFKCSQWQGNINDILHQKKPSQPAAGLPLSVSASHEQPAKIVWNKVSKSLVKIKINPVVICGEWRPQSTRSRRRLEGGRWELLRPREAPTD